MVHPSAFGATPEVASRRLVRALAGRGDVPARFVLQRWVEVPEPPPGERAITVDQTHLSIVVGEQVIVKWLRRSGSGDAAGVLAHLVAVGAGPLVPAPFGLVSDAAGAPVAFVSRFLPGARDGYEWCVERVDAALRGESAPGAGFPEELGRLTARLHVALATPSPAHPVPVRTERPGDAWRRRAETALRDVRVRVLERRELDGAPAGPDGQRLPEPPSAVLARALPELSDRLATLEVVTAVTQWTHGDLHVGQILRWPGGLAVIDLDGDPLEVGARWNPAARDVAHLLVSLDQVARIADRRTGFTRTAAADAWSRAARDRCRAGYTAELAGCGRAELFDAVLLPGLVAEQVARDLLYAAELLPRWAYAITTGLACLLG